MTSMATRSVDASPSSSPSTSFDVRPISGSLGAEVRGVHLADLDDATWEQLQAHWHEHLVLFFPDQHLTPDEHVALGRRFGEPEIHPYIPKLDDAHPEIIVLQASTGRKADTWHTDVTFSATPPMASILQMVRCPARGGDTMFSNQYLAYESLSAPVQELLSGLTAVHTAEGYGHPEINAVHPAVRVHPATGRRSLYVNRTFASHFVELRPSESNALLDYLCSWSEQPQFQCRYHWAEGTIGIWDNRCTQHFAVNDYTDLRIIHRVTVLGDAPQGGPSRWPAFEGDHFSELHGDAGRRSKAPTQFTTDARTNSVNPAS